MESKPLRIKYDDGNGDPQSEDEVLSLPEVKNRGKVLYFFPFKVKIMHKQKQIKKRFW